MSVAYYDILYVNLLLCIEIKVLRLLLDTKISFYVRPLRLWYLV